MEAKATKQKQFGLIASDGCLKGKVYEKNFEKHFPEAKILYPDYETQKLVTKGICNIKTVSRFYGENDPERPLTIFTEVAGRLRKAGAEKIIIGCTDIRVDYFDADNIDSLETLASFILEYST